MTKKGCLVIFQEKYAEGHSKKMVPFKETVDQTCRWSTQEGKEVCSKCTFSLLFAKEALHSHTLRQMRPYNSHPYYLVSVPQITSGTSPSITH